MITKHYLTATSLVVGLLIAQGSQAQNWNLSGNTSGNTATDTLGNINNRSMNIITNNTSRMFIKKTGEVGIGTTNPSYTLDIQTASNGAVGIKSTTGNANYFADKVGASSNAGMNYRSAGVPIWQTGLLATNDFSVKNLSIVPAANALTILTSNNNVGIGTLAPGARFDIQGSATSTDYILNVRTNYSGSSDIVGVNSYSKAADGWGYGIIATGGYYGGSFTGDGGAYTGGVTGVSAIASGSAGARYGLNASAYNTAGAAYAVYGYASGTTESWAGYFAGKAYAGELRVGTISNATGYIACFGGKIIATEVRVQLQPWPDYVFNNGYNLLSIQDLEKSISANKHLPGLPAACEVEENGLQLGEMQGKIVEKLEEAHLYIIQLQKQIDELKTQVNQLKK